MEYRYLRCESDNAQAMLDTAASGGWRVHTFTPRPRDNGNPVVDILFEREVFS